MKNDKNYEWHRYPETDAYLTDLVGAALAHMPQTSAFAHKLEAMTGSRLVDWLDHLVVTDGDAPRDRLADLGFEPEEAPAEPADTVYHHPGAIFPRVLLRRRGGVSPPSSAPGAILAIAIQVEDVRDLLMTQLVSASIASPPLSPYRQATVWQENGCAFTAIERRGYSGFRPVITGADYAKRYLLAYDRWATRPRAFADAREGMELALQLAQSLVDEMGADTAAWIAFSAEREYWQRRNQAGQVQKARQDSLGLGWANHDHHTFRSSRSVFPLLVEILETFGFYPRERFYAGAEAGWGAQVMEQPVCRLAVFADVDLSPDEVEGDFAHQSLAERHDLGTVGLWCALHGEAMLSAGLHHLAARFDFDAVTEDLAERGIGMMGPFSEFPYLRQAFTQGERWDVGADRLDRLVTSGRISDDQRTRFADRGAIGSHLENIQRADGFKGFNQEKISDIIRRTDPRADRPDTRV